MELVSNSSSSSEPAVNIDTEEVRIICRNGRQINFNRSLLRLYSKRFDGVVGLKECVVDVEVGILQNILDLCQLKDWKYFREDDPSNCGYSHDILVEILLVSESLSFEQIHEATFRWCLHPHFAKECFQYAVNKEYVNTMISILGHFKPHDCSFLTISNPEDPEVPESNSLFTRTQVMDLFTKRTGKTFPSGQHKTKRVLSNSKNKLPSPFHPHKDCDFRLKLPIRVSEIYPEGKVTFYVDKKVLNRASTVLQKKVTDDMDEFDCSELLEPIKYVKPYAQLFTNLMYPLSCYSLHVQQIDAVTPLCQALDFVNRDNYLSRQTLIFGISEVFGVLEFAARRKYRMLTRNLMDVRTGDELVVFVSAPRGFVWLDESELGGQIVANDGEMFTVQNVILLLKKLENAFCK